MNRNELVLAALAAAKGDQHTPVQVQKLFFLIDRNLADQIGGPQFNFQPYNYGPFDKAVYDEMESLAGAGLVNVTWEGRWRIYSLTPEGQAAGEKQLGQLGSTVQSYIVKVSQFVRKCSFSQLVTAIYNAYPEMRANSVFQG